MRRRWFDRWISGLPNGVDEEAAVRRGEQVKSVFDLYRGSLAESLGLQLPRTEAAEREMWELVSRRMTFRISEDVQSLDRFRKQETVKSFGRRPTTLKDGASNERGETKLDEGSTHLDYDTSENVEEKAPDEGV